VRKKDKRVEEYKVSILFHVSTSKM